jgi:aminopeptidase N
MSICHYQPISLKYPINPKCVIFIAQNQIMSYKIKSVATLLAAVVCGSVYGQHHAEGWRNAHANSKTSSAKVASKTTGSSHPDEDKYDVKYVKLNVEMTNIATTIGGDVTTTAQVTASALGSYVFEMLPPLVIDSVRLDGVLSTATVTGDTVMVPFATAKNMGEMFTAQVYYHGTPVSGTPSDIYGISALQSGAWGNYVTFTLSEPRSAENWWPCKQSLRDKIDSSDVWITVDDSLKAGSNGILTAVTPMGGGRNRYEWKERYPIDYYLISASVAKYVDYSYYMHFTGSADTMLVQNYIYDNPLTLLAFKNVIDSTANLVDYFSGLFGRYPFWKEKYGHCMAPLSGGQEHQTMTTLGFFQSWLVAHELGHQWFGDNVTCGTWRDIVMNEGFASYCEYLYLDHFRSHATAINDMVDRQVTVMGELGGSIYVDDTTDEGRIFDSRLSYDKGACAIHTLRHVINNDTYFFDLLHGWQSTMASSTGTIAEFRDLSKTLLGGTIDGISLDTFFQQWFYGEGYPVYTARWNQVGSDVYVQLDQVTTAPSSVALFRLPLELKLRSATGGDTTVRVNNDQASQTFHFNWSKTMNNLELDPNNWITDSVTSVTHLTVLGMMDVVFGDVNIYPNPSSTQWVASGLPAQSTLTLTDVTGKVIWRGANGNNAAINVPATGLAAGLYLLRVANAAAGERTYKVIAN